MKKIKKVGALFAAGYIGYPMLEMLWRGRTHISMAITGGVCFPLLYGVNHALQDKKLLHRCLFGSAAVTGVELTAGEICNRNHQVWDYSSKFLNFRGQICPQFSILWFLLCSGLFPLCSVIEKTTKVLD